MHFSRELAAFTLCLALFTPTASAQEALVPVIDGEWWQIAGDPDLGDYTREKQQPVDFGVWQAADGTWQLWSCIRDTGCGRTPGCFTAGKEEPDRYGLETDGNRDGRQDPIWEKALVGSAGTARRSIPGTVSHGLRRLGQHLLCHQQGW